MGSTSFYPEEAPIHTVRVGAFAIERHPVTNAQFAEFVDETGYVTVAEQRDRPGAVSRGRPGRSGARRAGVPADAAGRWTCGTGGSGGSGNPARAGVIRSARTAVSTIGWTIRSCRSPIPMRPPMPAGPAAGCRARPNGSTRRAAAAPPPIRGATIATPDGQLMANTWQGQFPVPERRRAGLGGDVAGRDLSAERLRPGRHDRQRLGVDDDRVRRTPPAGPTGAGVLSTGRRRGPDRQPGAQGWLAPVRARVLPPVPACGALAAVAGQRDHAHRIPLRGRLSPSAGRASRISSPP